MGEFIACDNLMLCELFEGFPDEIVLVILSYGTMKDIQSTRVWQSKDVKHRTGTRLKV